MRVERNNLFDRRFETLTVAESYVLSAPSNRETERPNYCDAAIVLVQPEPTHRRYGSGMVASHHCCVALIDGVVR